MRKALFVFILSTLVLTSCEQAASQPTTTDTATDTPVTFPTEPPAATQPPKPIIILSSEQEALKEEWRRAFWGSITLSSTCDKFIINSEKIQQGEIDSSQAGMNFYYRTTFVDAVNDIFETWEPSKNVAPYKVKIEAHLNIMIEVVRQWYNDEITIEDVPSALGETCTNLYETLEEIEIAALEAGMMEETLDELMTEIQEALERVGAGYPISDLF